MSEQKEIKWNNELIKLLQHDLKREFPNIKIIKGKVLKDIFLNKNPETKETKIQFGFVDQDLVFYEKTMDISDFHNVKNIIIHNNNVSEKNEMIIPKLICELKYDGINSHGLIIYSEYASDIKSIFPECKYWLALRYRKSSSENKLNRHGKNFDKIICFDNGKVSKTDNENFENQLKNNSVLKNIYSEFLEEIKETLRIKETNFAK